MSEASVMTKILSTLPQKYRSFRQAWLSMSSEQQTVRNLISRLLDEESSLSLSENFDSALSTESKKKASTKECFYCKKPGHFKRNCREWLKAKNQDSQGSGVNDSRKNIVVKNKSALNAILVGTRDDNQWILVVLLTT